MINSKRKYFTFFAGLIIFSLILIFLSKSGLLNSEISFFQKIFFSISLPVANKTKKLSQSELLQNANVKILAQDATIKNLQNNNSALYDQFKTAYPNSLTLIPANIVGFPDNFQSENIAYFILDKGYSNNVGKKNIVVFKNNFIGIISDANLNYSKVETLFSGNFTLAGRDVTTNAYGIIKNEDGEIILDNILTSSSLKIGDLVETAPGQNYDGSGVMPNLIIGKIVSIQKIPSSLFQKAKIEPLYNYKNLEIVFIHS